VIIIHSPKKLAEILEYSLADIYAVIERIKSRPRSVYYSFTSRTIKAGKVKERPIDPSRDKLRDLQNRIYERILKKIPLPPHVMGSRRGKNNIDNAADHRGGLFHFETDLKNFFGFATSKMVFDALRTQGYSPDICHILTQLTTFKGHIPQGAPTSAILANLVGLSFDKPILALCAEHQIKYTRYVDDLWFSAEHSFTALEQPILRVIEDNQFLYSHRKTVAKAGTIEGTGVKVNKGGRLSLTDAQEKKLADPNRSELSKQGLESYKRQVEKK